MRRGGELPAVCAGAGIDTPSDTPPALIGCCESGTVDSCKWSQGQQVEPEEPDFFSQIICLMFYSQDIVTVLVNATKNYFYTSYLLLL